VASSFIEYQAGAAFATRGHVSNQLAMKLSRAVFYLSSAAPNVVTCKTWISGDPKADVKIDQALFR
jgi:hypothetical protein